MTIGAMNDRILVKKLQKVSNGRGGWIINEITIGTFWGEVETLSAKNIVQYRQADLNVNAQITMRFNDQINRECALYARGHKYLIEEAIEEEGFLVLLAVGEYIGG